MKRVLAWLLVAAALPAGAQEGVVDADDLVNAAQEWMRDNIDEAALRALTGVDQARVQEFLRELQQRLGGQYVVDLAALKEGAAVVLPLLESYEETAPYAAWLKARLDYFEVADRLRREALPPKTPPSQPAAPSLEKQRRAWIELLDTRAVPKPANSFIARLKPIFVEAKIPAELAWLAEVESGFNAGARSPVGAAGLYQLMPATARRVGLALAPKDERLQPDKNARAAAHYLRYLYARFKDWPLALAAYNAGEGKVQKLLDRYHARSFDRIALHLPAETQMYVPKVEATLWRREKVTLAKLRAPAGA